MQATAGRVPGGGRGPRYAGGAKVDAALDLWVKGRAMLGRVEQAEAGVVTKSAPYGKLMMVSQTKIRTIGGGPMDDSSLSHTKWKCQYHIVFIPKYRRKTMYGRVKEDIREILKTLCSYKKVEIIEGAACVDHIHLCVSIPPKLSVSDFMGYLKGKSALMIFDKHPDMGSKFNRHFWARGYYVATVGNITEEAIMKYIKEQQEEDRKEDKALS